MEEPYDRDFPELDYLFGCYLNQDYVIHGSTIGDAVLAYARDERPEVVSALQAEIERLLVTYRGGEDAELDRIDRSRAQPPGLGARDYLQMIRMKLGEAEHRHAAE